MHPQARKRLLAHHREVGFVTINRPVVVSQIARYLIGAQFRPRSRISRVDPVVTGRHGKLG